MTQLTSTNDRSGLDRLGSPDNSSAYAGPAVPARLVVADDDEARRRRQSGERLVELGVHRGIGEQHRAPRVGEHVLEHVAAVRRVDRHGDRPELAEGEVDREERLAVREHQADVVSPADAHRDERRGQPPALIVDAAVRQRSRRQVHDRVVRRLGGAPLEQARDHHLRGVEVELRQSRHRRGTDDGDGSGSRNLKHIGHLVHDVEPNDARSARSRYGTITPWAVEEGTAEHAHRHRPHDVRRPRPV